MSEGCTCPKFFTPVKGWSRPSRLTGDFGRRRSSLSSFGLPAVAVLPAEPRDRASGGNMPPPTSVADLDLSPPAGKTYFNSEREWREEFIYFLMTDRFHDDRPRTPTLKKARSSGIPAPNGFFGGTLKGIRQNLDYIAGLGCTAVWLSPVFVTNAYHGYDIRNYLDIDPHFGTKDDLVALVAAAHERDMRVILDVVINHSGDNWEYQGGPKNFSGGARF